MESRTRWLLWVISVGAALAPQTSLAQASLQGSLEEAPINNFARDRNVSVTERPHPDYEAVGIHEGGFILWPKLTVITDYNDNIFAAPSDAVADGVTHITPEIDLTSNWSRHSLQAYVRGGFNQYWQNSNQNTDDFAVGAKGQLDVQRTTQVNAGVDYSRQTEPRTTATSAGNPFPIQYDLAAANLSAAKQFNRLRLSGRFDFQNYDYLNRSGNVPQDDRNHNDYIGTIRADYAVSPATALFVEVAGNDHDYKLKSSPIVGGVPEFQDFVRRDSHGIQVLAGANFELGALVRGELGVGYLKQSYKDKAFSDVSGPGARVQLEWFPTQLTTVTVTGTRTVEDAGLIGASSYLSNNFGLKVDHELLRNLILNANAAYGKDVYHGISRDDKRYIAGVGATYMMNRHVGLTFGYSHFKQNSSGADASVALGNFTVNRVSMTLALQY